MKLFKVISGLKEAFLLIGKDLDVVSIRMRGILTVISRYNRLLN